MGTYWFHLQKDECGNSDCSHLKEPERKACLSPYERVAQLVKSSSLQRTPGSPWLEQQNDGQFNKIGHSFRQQP